jgi:hypothetical protein
MLDFAALSEKMLEEQPGFADSFITIPSILFITELPSEMIGMPAWGLVVASALGEAGLAAGILLSAAACANICTPANNKTAISNCI